MMYGNRTFKMENVAVTSPSQTNFTNAILDNSQIRNGQLNVLSVGSFVPIIPSGGFSDLDTPTDTPELIGDESPVDEEPVDEPVQTDEESTAPEVIQNEINEPKPEDEVEPEPETRIRGGSVEFALPDWFKSRFMTGAKVVGAGAVAYVGYIVADKTGLLEKAKGALTPSDKASRTE